MIKVGLIDDDPGDRRVIRTPVLCACFSKVAYHWFKASFLVCFG